jgi:hypothetical protein
MSYERAIRHLASLLGLAVLALSLGACAAPAQLSSAFAATPTAWIEPPPSPAPTPTPAPEAGQTGVESAPAAPARPAMPVNLTQSAEAGAVTVEVTPLNLQDARAETLDFTITMNTHSVDLGVDLARMAVLQVGDAEIAAARWQAPAGGGHHVQGTLSFPATDGAGKRVLEGATSITLVIRGLAGVEERAFTWDLTAATRARPSAGATSAGEMGMQMPTMGTAATSGQGMMAMMQSMPVTGTMPMTATMPMRGQDVMSMMQNMMQMMQQMPDDQQQHMMPQMMQMMQSMMEMMRGTIGQMKGMPMQDMMDMGGAGSMEAGHMAPIPSVGMPDATEKTGAQPLAFREEDGVKVFELTTRPVRWPILEEIKVTAWTYNGTVPGPLIRVTEGDRVRVLLKNALPEPTSIHWHGIPVPNAMDGVPPYTQPAIEPGQIFTYEFTAPAAGTFMYHSHVETDKQIMVGLYGPFIVDPKEPPAKAPDVDVMWMLSEWRVGSDGETYPAMPMAGSEPNYFTINGKSFPNTAPIVVQQGDRVRIRLANVGQFTHPMHLHGMNFRIVAYDGVPLPPEQQIVRNTVPVNPGEVIDIEFVADNSGTWVFHCHIPHHVTNNNVEPGGLIGIVEVKE